MGPRTVRLDQETEDALEQIRKETGMTISDALKQGLLVLRDQVLYDRPVNPWDVYERIDLGPGGYLPAPAKEAKKAVLEQIRRKHRR